jgi:hypothetical protein
VGQFAEKTSVSSEQSRSEIERILTRYGATSFMYGWQGDSAVVAFEMQCRRICFRLPMPPKTSPEFTKTPGGRRIRSTVEANKAWEQGCRQRWRALALVIKAKLEAVETGITVFEDEFLAHIVLPDGQTVGGFMQPQIEAAYQTGKMPALLPYMPFSSDQ